MNTTYALDPIPQAEAAGHRKVGGEVYVADEKPGFPCRQCLRDADVGDELILISHDPFACDSPYRSASPIFIHRHDCGSPTTDRLPVQLTGRQLSVRAFDSHEMMIDATVIEGAELDATLTRLFANENADHVHVHNATRGCWATSIRRTG